MKIIPAILAKTEDEFTSMVKKVEPHTDLVQIDIADGSFVPNKTIDGYEELKKMDTKLNFEVHLMVKNPENAIDHWFGTKAIRYLVHWETVSDIEFLINKITMSGREIGCVFNSKTSYSGIEPFIERISLIQFMTVEPGFYGSSFMPEVLDKIRNFHINYPRKPIQVDGGIKPEMVKLVESCGVTSAAVGSYIFQSNDIEQAIKNLNV